MAKRIKPSESTLKALFAKSRNLCAFEGCNHIIVDEDTNTIVGEVAHIEGVGKRAARHNPNRTAEELCAFDNLILLCEYHHKMIDAKNSGYTVERLREMKRRHEQQGRIEIMPVDGRLARIYSEQRLGTKRVRTTNANRTYNHSIHAEASGNATQTVNIFNRPPKDPLPDDAINSDAEKRAYVIHLQERFIEFDSKYTQKPEASAANIYRAIRKKFHTKAVAVPLSRFGELCTFLQAKIDNTNIGKGNLKKGIPNYAPFSPLS